MAKDLKKQIKISKMLGAKKFQVLVYKVEQIKFYLLKHQLSFLVPKIEKNYQKQRDKMLSKTHSIEQQEIINNIYKRRLILFRKELAKEQSRNYHFGVDNFKDFKDYLLWNKEIHAKGIKNNLIAIAINALLTILIPGLTTITIPLTGGILVKLVIDFECVNLQNYHLSRYEKIKEKMQNKQKQNILKINKKHSEVINAVDKQITTSKELPKLEKSIYQMKREELLKLRELLIELTPQQVQENTKKLEH